MTPFTAGVVADLHLRSLNVDDILSVLSDQRQHIFREGERLSEGSGVDMVVVLGDIVAGTDAETDRMLLSRVAGFLMEWDVSIRVVPGNHDVVTASPATLTEEFGQSDVWWLDTDRELVFLDSSGPDLLGSRGELNATQVSALCESLPALDNGLVFVHHPLYPHDLANNPLFAPYPEEAVCGNRRGLADVLSATNVAAVLSGHLHDFQIATADGPVHLSVDAFNKSPTGGTAGAYAVVSRRADGSVAISHTNGDGQRYTLDSAGDHRRP